MARHGRPPADEVGHLLAGPLRPLGSVSAARFQRLELRLARAVARAERAMDFYGLPTRLAEDVEERVIGAVHALLRRGEQAPV